MPKGWKLGISVNGNFLKHRGGAILPITRLISIMSKPISIVVVVVVVQKMLGPKMDSILGSIFG